MKNGLCFYLWLQIYPYLPAEYLRPVWMKSKTVNYLLQSFVYSGKIQRAGVLGPAVLQTQFSFS